MRHLGSDYYAKKGLSDISVLIVADISVHLSVLYDRRTHRERATKRRRMQSRATLEQTVLW